MWQFSTYRLAAIVVKVCVPPVNAPAGITFGVVSPPSAEVVQLICVKGMTSPAALVRLAGDVTCSSAVAGPSLALLR